MAPAQVQEALAEGDAAVEAYTADDLVIFLFLRKLWATVIPGISLPISLIGTFGVMYLFNARLQHRRLLWRRRMDNPATHRSLRLGMDADYIVRDRDSVYGDTLRAGLSTTSLHKGFSRASRFSVPTISILVGSGGGRPARQRILPW
jgi:AcrB/AcrD/AcrF family protein